jgi:hypothetical protein
MYLVDMRLTIGLTPHAYDLRIFFCGVPSLFNA